MDAALLLGIVGAAGTLASRHFIIRALKSDVPREYISELGAPAYDQLWSRAFDSPARKQLQSRFASFIWTGEFLRVRSASVKFWGLVTVLSNLSLVAAVCLLLYQKVNDG